MGNPEHMSRGWPSRYLFAVQVGLDGSDNRVYLSPGGKAQVRTKEEVKALPSKGLWRSFARE